MFDSPESLKKKNSSSPMSMQNFRGFALILLFVILVFQLVYLKNGTSTAYTQLMNIPIILSAFYWRVSGGLLTALVAGILLGPFMPLNVFT